MDLSKQENNGNLDSTANGEEAKSKLANGVSGADEFSRENEGKGEKVVNGTLKPEVLKRYAPENISEDSNSDDHGESENKVSSLDDTNGDDDITDLNSASELSEISIGDSYDDDSSGSDEIRKKSPGKDVVENKVSLDDMIMASELSEITTRDSDEGETPENDVVNENRAVSPKINGDVEELIRPHSQLPKPEAPPGHTCSPRDDDNDEIPPINRSQSLPEKASVDMPAIGKFIREKSNSFSAAIVKRLSSLKDNDETKSFSYPSVTEFNLSGLKVIVKLKETNEIGDLEHEFKGRITFFTRSNCRDCSAVRSFFRERGLKFFEINIDVYTMREKELFERTGSSSVPQIFFNEKLFGGLVALNSLRNSGLFEQRMKEMLGRKCPDDAPAPPVYGFDDQEEERTDEMVKIVRVLRQRLPIQDRLMKMKIVKNCFAGSEMVEVIIQHLDCGRRKAVEIGKRLARKHFIHHVFGENEFEDGHHFYRFLEHEPFIPKCFNFRGCPNDSEPKPAAMVSQRLTKIMYAILESYASEDRGHLDYVGISNSEEFRRYVNLVQDLHRVNILELSADEKLAFFLNLYNAMVIHAVIRVGHPGAVMDRRSFFSDFQYLVGGHPYSLTVIKNGILRSNRRPPYSLVKPFGAGDKRLEVAFTKVNPLIHFGLCNGTRSSPTVRFFTPQGVESELRNATREFFKTNGIEVDLAKRTVHLTRIMKLFNADFGQDKEMLKWIINYLDATKAGLLTHLLGDGGPINIVYQNFDWSVNS